METHLAYCSACDREVRVALAPDYEPEPGKPIPPEAMVCLDHGEVCTGALCPLFGVPPKEMKEKLERSGARRGRP
jgi:hypothetical protein